MVRWVVGSILHWVNPLSFFSFQPVLHDWCNNGRGMCNPLCGMVHIKEPLLLIGKSRPCGGSGFPLSLSEWSFTICTTPYNCKLKNVLNASLNKTFPSFLPSFIPLNFTVNFRQLYIAYSNRYYIFFKFNYAIPLTVYRQ